MYDDDGVSGNLLLACRRPRRRWPYISGGGEGPVLVAETEHSKRGGWDGAFPLTLKITVQAKNVLRLVGVSKAKKKILFVSCNGLKKLGR